ncbi:MAG: asparagine synthase (glutamine-hydrolyzing) [Microgenomates group bacterium]
MLNRRLAIIDIKGGNQPIYNEDKSIVVVYNGEIYNYHQLRQELKKAGHIFKTNSDTEVIVHGYEQWQEKCFDKFNGMFAVALYDKKKKKLVLARDHFGIKPLYYAIITEKPIGQFSDKSQKFKLIFSSEIKPIFYSGLVEKEPNNRVIYRYLKFRVHDDSKETFFKGIYRLMPGEIIEIQNSKLKIKNYTNLEKELLRRAKTETLSKGEIKEFEKKLTEAIRLRLISEVPVGSCLSGGLDSSTVVALVNKLLKEKVNEAQSVGKIQKTFSAVFPREINDEEKYIDILKSQISNLRSYKIYPKPEDFFDEIEDFIKTQEEPTISTGPYAQFKVMQLAQKYVTVVLDGQGADEMLAGYLPYYFVYLRQLLKEVKNKGIKFLIKEIWGMRDILSKYGLNKLIHIIGFKQEISADKLLKKQFVVKFLHERHSPTVDNLKRRLIEDIFYFSLPSLLRYEDKNSMRFSIEGRVPFLDFNLARYLFSLPTEAIINNGWNKFVLREVTKNLLPKEINQRRNKIGFTTPEYQWFMRMKNKIYEIFLSESFAKRKYFNHQEVLKAFQKFIEGKVEDTMLFWRLLNLELWLRIFFDKSYKVKVCKVRKWGEPNEGKKLEIEVEGKKYLRYPIRTELFKKGDDYSQKIYDSFAKFLSQVNSALRSSNIHSRKNLARYVNKNKFFLVVSEKIVAIAQGRSYFLWEIKPTLMAKILSHFVTKTPYGIGLGSPWTMQLAINEVGWLRIFLAALVSAVTKLFGLRGLFYWIVGDAVRSIDGPTEYSLYPSNVSAKLGPKNPQKVAEDIHNWIKSKINKNQKSKFKIENFLGVVIIDANDLGQNVLGNSTGLPNELIEKIFADNPMGQSDEQTPLVVVVSQS